MWFILISLCSSISLIMALAICLCWKKKTEKNELLGLEGMVTQKNPDENVNHLPSATSRIVDGTILTSSENADAHKRNVLVNNPRRSLPDIPSEGQERLQNETVIWEPSGDNSSDLYASVDQYQSSNKRQAIANGLETRPSVSQHSSISQGDDAFSPYARVNYEQLQKREHPYARLQNNSSRVEENSLEEPTSRTSLLRHENINHNQNTVEPVAPPRSGRSSAQSGNGIDIPAASAVAGGIAASQELPYMTPPIAQTNFSGDSQDSSKGYTSISVREPLANIIAQTKEMNKLKRDLDPHYATVSDDSDDVYTTIPDPNNPVYTSGSETYARIPPLNVTVEAEINSVPASVQGNDDVSVPEPPSVDSLRHVTHSHSRQASSSSSIANIGSPKPEKRQANSPLPPPPSVSPDISTTHEKVHSAKNLDDMYAKVHKNKKRSNTEEVDLEVINQKLVHETTNKTSSTSSIEDKTNLAEPCKLGLSEIDGKPLRHEHNYETLRKSPRKCVDPGYEKIRQDKDDCNSEPGYASINGPDSILSSDPGYEVLKQGAPSETDPNYEELRHNTSDCGGYSRINVNNIVDGYSVVNKQANNGKSATSSSYESDTRDFSFDEPNYESMPSESLSEHNYAALKSTDSESDPNYESVNQNDPNYESVKYLGVVLDDPPYERLRDDDSSCKSNHAVQDYETVQGSAHSDPPYEILNNDADHKASAAVKSSENGYEKVKNNVSSVTKNSSQSTDVKIGSENNPSFVHSDSDDDVIIQV